MVKKPHGLLAARKLKEHRKSQRWADKNYKKSTKLKTASPFGGASHAMGVVLSKLGIEAKQPNSAIRKCVRVQLIKNGRIVIAFVPGDGALNYIEENDSVLLSGLGRSGKTCGDLPGVHAQVIKVGGVSFARLERHKNDRWSD